MRWPITRHIADETGPCCALCFTSWTGPHLKLGGGSGLAPLGFVLLCCPPVRPKAQTRAVTSSVDPTTPFCELSFPLAMLSLCHLWCTDLSLFALFLLHDDESEALAFLPCTPPFSEAKPFLDTRARPVAPYLPSLHSLPWVSVPGQFGLSVVLASCNSDLDRCYEVGLTANGQALHGPWPRCYIDPTPKGNAHGQVSLLFDLCLGLACLELSLSPQDGPLMAPFPITLKQGLCRPGTSWRVGSALC